MSIVVWGLGLPEDGPLVAGGLGIGAAAGGSAGVSTTVCTAVGTCSIITAAGGGTVRRRVTKHYAQPDAPAFVWEMRGHSTTLTSARGACGLVRVLAAAGSATTDLRADGTHSLVLRAAGPSRTRASAAGTNAIVMSEARIEEEFALLMILIRQAELAEV